MNEIPRINAGGCAHVAIELHTYIEKLGYRADICFLYQSHNDLQYEAINNNIATSCAHAVVRVNNLYIDSTGFHNKTQLKEGWEVAYIATVPPDLARKTLNTSSELCCWNPAFDKAKHTKTIKRILK